MKPHGEILRPAHTLLESRAVERTGFKTWLGDRGSTLESVWRNPVSDVYAPSSIYKASRRCLEVLSYLAEQPPLEVQVAFVLSLVLGRDIEAKDALSEALDFINGPQCWQVMSANWVKYQADYGETAEAVACLFHLREAIPPTKNLSDYKPRLRVGSRFTSDNFIGGRWHHTSHTIWEVLEVVERGIVVGHLPCYGHRHLRDWTETIRNFQQLA